MCSVVFIPNGDKYYFVSLRDESPHRPKASVPVIYRENGSEILSPRDAKAGGTWLGVTSTGTVIILLNGGFKKHEVQVTYRKSRGLIVSELLASKSPVINWALMDMKGIEPHTLVVWYEEKLFHLVWDGINKTEIILNPNQPHLWSSATLYEDEARVNRSILFKKWIETNTPINSLSLCIFFKSFKDSQNGFLINRDELIKTLSYTFIELQVDDSAKMQYHDFNDDTYHTEKIWFNNEINNSNFSKKSMNKI